MKVEITNKQLVELVSILFTKYNTDKEKTEKVEETIEEAIFKKSCLNVLAQCKPLFEDYQSDVEEKRIENCLVDEKTKKIIKNEKGEYEYSPEGLKNYNAAIKELNNKKVTIHARIKETNDKLINTLTFDELCAFSKILISEQNFE